MAHQIGMELPTTKTLLSKDVIFRISNKLGKLGELHISKGNVEWIPFKSKTKKKCLSWEKFSQIMGSETVKTVRKPKRA